MMELFGDSFRQSTPNELKAAAESIFNQFLACKDIVDADQQTQQMNALRAEAAIVKEQVETANKQATGKSKSEEVTACLDIMSKNGAGSALVARIQEKLAACQKIATLDQQVAELSALKEQAKGYAILVATCNAKLRNQPQKKQEFLDALQRNPSPDRLTALLAELKSVEEAGAARAKRRLWSWTAKRSPTWLI